MTIDEGIEVLIRHKLHWEHLSEQGICDVHEGKETISALTMSIASLEAWEKVKQETQEIKAYEVSTGRNKTGLKVKMEALMIIDKHLQEVEE